MFQGGEGKEVTKEGGAVKTTESIVPLWELSEVGGQLSVIIAHNICVVPAATRIRVLMLRTRVTARDKDLKALNHHLYIGRTYYLFEGG